MQESIERVTERFARIDEATAAFAARTGIGCPPRCGSCCRTPEIDATVGEMLPMAVALVREGRALEVRALLERHVLAGDTRCALYEPDAAEPARGRCIAYALRPAVCRLFGFAARRDRTGQLELVQCHTMRDADPRGVASAAAAVRSGVEVPVYADHGFAGDEVAVGAALLPINTALGEALARAMLAESLRALEAEPADRNPAQSR